MSLLGRVFGWDAGDARAGMPAVDRGSQATDTGPKAFDWRGLGDSNLTDWLGQGGTRVGRVVGERRALANSSMFRGVNLIASTIGQLPLNLMVRASDGTVAKADRHPVQRLLRRSPNPLQRQTPFEFKSYMQGRALLKGNAFAFKVPGARGVQALAALDPDRVRIEQQADWTLQYVWSPPRGAVRRFSQDEIFHLRAPWSSDGVHGDGLLKLAAEAIAQADASAEITSRMLGNGSFSGGKITAKKQLTEEAALRLKRQFEDNNSGPENAGRWLVLEEDMDASPFGMSGRDAQAVEQMKLMIETMGRFTGVPRPLLMMDDTSWGSGIEQLGLYFVTYCLLPWFVAWEEAVARSLLTDAERDTMYAKFNDAALLRGSLKDQAEFLAKALGGPGTTGYMMPNEARDKMELPPVDGGDQPNWGTTNNATP
jgi:HK97 family phage portal protein